MTVTDVGQLDAENRTTICQMILCDPYAGYLAREFLEAFPLYRGTPDGALLELMVHVYPHQGNPGFWRRLRLYGNHRDS